MDNNGQEERKDVLDLCVGHGQRLVKLVEYAEDSIVSKSILDKQTGTLTLFAFDKGQRLSEHTAPYDAVVEIIAGTARLTIGSREVRVSAGEIIIMPGNVPHAVYAEERFKMLLTMVRA